MGKLSFGLNEMYAKLDKMKSKGGYIRPTEGYFPTLAEVNTYLSEDPENMLPFMTWLNDNLKRGDTYDKEAVIAFKNKAFELLG